MAAHASVRVGRLPFAAAAAGTLALVDLGWKAASLAAGLDSVDAPSSLVKPVATVIAVPILILAVATVPSICLPGALLALAGVTGNLASLAIWHAVPNPLSIGIADGRVHFNLADVCIWSGCAAFVLSAIWAIWRLPADRFA